MARARRRPDGGEALGGLRRTRGSRLAFVFPRCMGGGSEVDGGILSKWMQSARGRRARAEERGRGRSAGNGEERGERAQRTPPRGAPGEGGGRGGGKRTRREGRKERKKRKQSCTSVDCSSRGGCVDGGRGGGERKKGEKIRPRGWRGKSRGKGRRRARGGRRASNESGERRAGGEREGESRVGVRVKVTVAGGITSGKGEAAGGRSGR